MGERSWWPTDPQQLAALQRRLAAEAADALATRPWSPPAGFVAAGVVAAFARPGIRPGTGPFVDVTDPWTPTGPGRADDRGWAAAVAWRAPSGATRPRVADRHLRGSGPGRPRRADDVCDQAVVCGRAPAPYVPGLLAAREGPLLAAAVAALTVRPDVLLVDATGADHPRGAGLALHLGAATGIPAIGVTRRPLVASGSEPPRRRGATAGLVLDGRTVAAWVCTRTGSRCLVAHPGWRTTIATAVAVVLATSTPAARTPVPLQEARRVAREARALGTDREADP